MTLRRALATALMGAGLLAGGTLRAQAPLASNEVLHYSAEWRFVNGGEIELRSTGLIQTHMTLTSAGMVSRLFRVDDDYAVTRDEQGCSQTIDFKVREGRRSRDIHSTFDKQKRKATYLERDAARDGKKTANIRVEAQRKETIRTPLGQFPSTLYEAFVFSGAYYGRKGRLFVWITDDERRLPIQLKIQLPFYVGTITLQLEKVERN